jgi:hypothetical protein
MDESQGMREFDANEKRIVHFTGFAHAATHYVELLYPTLAVGLVAQTPGVDSIEEAATCSSASVPCPRAMRRTDSGDAG